MAVRRQRAHGAARLAHTAAALGYSRRDRRDCLAHPRRDHLALARRCAAVRRCGAHDREPDRAVHDDAQVSRELAALDRGRRILRGHVHLQGPQPHSVQLRRVSRPRGDGLRLVETIARRGAGGRGRTGVIRVVVTGSESTGKTTLGKQLAEHYRAELVPEFVREYAEQKRAPIGFNDHGPIARGQIALEDDYIARARHLVVQDTDLLSTVVYCDHYFGRCPPWIAETAAQRKPNLYLLCEIDVPWEADGI